MGSFNVACTISGISINPGTKVAYIPLEVSPYPYKIGLENNMLIYMHCFYAPVTLPIFGEYADYGYIEDFETNKNTEVITNYFGCSLEDIVNMKTKPISSGMFIHRKVYDFLSSGVRDEWGRKLLYSHNELEKLYEKYVKDIKKEQAFNSKFGFDFSFSIYSAFRRREYETFNKIYMPTILDKTFKSELIDFVIFEGSMYSINKFYFPAMNGCQFGNKFALRDFYNYVAKITNSQKGQ